MTSDSKSLHQIDTSVLPRPRWQTSGRRSAINLLGAVIRELRAMVLRYVRFKGNKTAYLRHIGVDIGEDCAILTDISNFGTEPWLIQIGNRVTITSGVVFLTHDGASRLIRHLLPNSSRWGNRFGPIIIGNNCFVGVNSIIMPGVRIGENSIVGVGSVVNKSVDPGTVVGGVPARFICTLDDYIDRYRQKMIPITATNRTELRKELTRHFWGTTR